MLPAIRCGAAGRVSSGWPWRQGAHHKTFGRVTCGVASRDAVWRGQAGCGSARQAAVGIGKGYSLAVSRKIDRCRLASTRKAWRGRAGLGPARLGKARHSEGCDAAVRMACRLYRCNRIKQGRAWQGLSTVDCIACGAFQWRESLRGRAGRSRARLGLARRGSARARKSKHQHTGKKCVPIK